MDAIALLKADHATMRALLGKLEKTTARGVKRRRELLVQVDANLKAHTSI